MLQRRVSRGARTGLRPDIPTHPRRAHGWSPWAFRYTSPKAAGRSGRTGSVRQSGGALRANGLCGAHAVGRRANGFVCRPEPRSHRPRRLPLSAVGWLSGAAEAYYEPDRRDHEQQVGGARQRRPAVNGHAAAAVRGARRLRRVVGAGYHRRRGRTRPRRRRGFRRRSRHGSRRRLRRWRRRGHRGRGRRRLRRWRCGRNRGVRRDRGRAWPWARGCSSEWGSRSPLAAACASGSASGSPGI